MTTCRKLCLRLFNVSLKKSTLKLVWELRVFQHDCIQSHWSDFYDFLLSNLRITTDNELEYIWEKRIMCFAKQQQCDLIIFLVSLIVRIWNALILHVHNDYASLEIF